MSSKQLPMVIALIHPHADRSRLQNVLDKCANQVTVIPYVERPKERRPLVEGVIIYGLHIAINADFMDLYPNLRVISCTSSGTEHVDVAEATKRGIKVGNTKDEVRDATADHAFALLLASARNVVQNDATCKSPTLQKYDVDFFGQQVSGSTLGIIGLGSIGTGVAERAKGFRIKTLYYSRTRRENLENQLGVEYCHHLEDLLKQADFVVLCARHTSQTQHMISAFELSCMKPTATLINVARGGLVNQDDLVTALKTGQIHAAALDVTTPEQLPRDHPLLTFPNVIITPHSASATSVCRRNMMTKSIDNLIAGLKGDPLPSSAL